MKSLKNIAILVSPLALFVILLIPYSLINEIFIVNLFGCGCNPHFNANDFTALFWLFISICATTVSVFLSKRIPEEKKWIKVLYIVSIFLISLSTTYKLCQIMMWK